MGKMTTVYEYKYKDNSDGEEDKISLRITSVFKGNKNWETVWGDIDNCNNHRIYLTNTRTNKTCSFEFWNSIIDGEITTESELLGALECFLSGVSGYVNTSGFESWCHEYGYNYDEDKDYRHARKVYRAIAKTVEQAEKICPEVLPEYGDYLWGMIEDVENKQMELSEAARVA